MFGNDLKVGSILATEKSTSLKLYRYNVSPQQKPFAHLFLTRLQSLHPLILANIINTELPQRPISNNPTRTKSSTSHPYSRSPFHNLFTKL